MNSDDQFLSYYRVEEAARERFSPIAWERRLDYTCEIANYRPQQIFFMDESGIDFKSLHRGFGRTNSLSNRPRRIRRYVKASRANLLSCIGLNGVQSFRISTGTTNSDEFNSYMVDLVLPKLPRGSALVLDNASFHQTLSIPAFARELGIEILFLPPYSPDLNPIEISYGWLKKALKADIQGSTSFDDLIQRIAYHYSSITSSHTQSWYQKCFYLDYPEFQ